MTKLVEQVQYRTSTLLLSASAREYCSSTGQSKKLIGPPSRFGILLLRIITHPWLTSKPRPEPMDSHMMGGGGGFNPTAAAYQNNAYRLWRTNDRKYDLFHTGIETIAVSSYSCSRRAVTLRCYLRGHYAMFALRLPK